VTRERRRSIEDGVLAEEVGGFQLVLRALELLVGNDLRAQALDLGGQRALGLLHRSVGQHGDVESERVRIQGQARVVTPRLERDPRLVDESPVEP
jgi:hypothetical protein